MAKNKKKDFLENRTDWRFFERLLKNYTDQGKIVNENTLAIRIQLEILKELQFLNK